jgi:hypothetical protein
MYVTTFPCHSCARHIVASGISRVVYIEPYPKSLALTLHVDAVSVDERDSDSRVIFLQYEGVAPRNMVRLFHSNLERKKDGHVVTREPRQSAPLTHAPLDAFATREQFVLEELERRRADADSKGSSGHEPGRRKS